MADDKVPFEIVIPARILLSDEADMVVIPGGDGDFGVLPGHAPLLSTIRPGVLDVHRNGMVSQRFFVAGGFAEVSPEGCVILAEEAVALEDIDRDAAQERVDAARKALNEADEDDKANAESLLKTAEAYLEASETVRGRA